MPSKLEIIGREMTEETEWLIRGVWLIFLYNDLQ